MLADTCGKLAMDCSRVGLKPLANPATPPLLTTKSARTAELIAVSADAFVDDARTFIKLTTATLTMRAAAAAEVRAGLPRRSLGQLAGHSSPAERGAQDANDRLRN